MEEKKADKIDLEALKKFIQSSIGNLKSSDNSPFEGFDQLDEIVRRLDNFDLKLKE